MTESFVNVRFQAAQLGRLDELCDTRGVSRSDLIRGLVMDAVMAPADRDTVPDEAELLRLLSDKARAGNVSAIKTLLDRHERHGWNDVDDPFAELDELDGGSAISRLARRRNGHDRQSS